MKQDSSNLILQMRNIHYAFGKTPVLNGVDFELRPGEIHALVGEHRSGKSTLMKILSGDFKSQRGRIYLRDQEIVLSQPSDATRFGIGMIHQNLTVIPSLNAVENIFSSSLPQSWFGMGKYGKMVHQSKKLLKLLGREIDLMVPLKELSTPEMQSVEIARILAANPDIIIFDEISSRQNAQELEKIFDLLLSLREKGKSIIYVTPNIDEIFEIADRVTVLKSGYRRSTEQVKDLDRLRLLRLAYGFALDIRDSGAGKEDDTRNLLYLKGYNENIIKDLPVGVLVLDKSHLIYYMNHAAEKTIHTNIEKTLHRPVSELIRQQTPEFAERILRSIEDQERKVWEGVPFGNAQFVKIRVLPLRDEDMVFAGSMIILEDVSMDFHIRDYLAQSEKMAANAEIAAGVAHEINNPLGIIQNYVALLKMKQLDLDSKTKLEKIENELARIVEIVGSLLSFSRIKTNEASVINLTGLMDEIITLLNHRFHEKQIRITKNYLHEKIPVKGDENRLKQLFINLIVNSIEAVLDNGHIQIEIRKRNSKHEAKITITDNGYGIPKEIQEEIFSPFFSTKVTKKNTGLGLSICRHIVELHDGSIDVASHPGEDTSFTIRLPLQESTT